MKIQQKKRQSRVRKLWIGAFLSIIVVSAAAYLIYQKTTTNHPSSDQPVAQTQSETSGLSVFSEMPDRLKIDKIGVDAKIVSVGLTDDGAMDAPSNLADVGWYNQSSKAGESNYAILLDGHHGVGIERGVFERLGEVAEGDQIVLTSDKGTKLTYKVREVETKPYRDVDMNRALNTYEPNLQSLTIITCEGQYSQAEATYDQRTVVYAERIK